MHVTLEQEFLSKPRPGTKGMIAFMQEHGSSVTLNFGEDTGQWEVSWIRGGERFTGINKDVEYAINDCLHKTFTASKQHPCPHTFSNGNKAWGCVLPYGHAGNHHEYAQPPQKPDKAAEVDGLNRFASARHLDICNLRFYSAMAHDLKWQTDTIHWSVISNTLQEIADRLAAE